MDLLHHRLCRHKWSSTTMCCAQDSKHTWPRLRFAFSFRPPHPRPHRPGTSSFAILHMWQKWQLLWCKIAISPTPPVQPLCARCKIGPEVTPYPLYTSDSTILEGHTVWREEVSHNTNAKSQNKNQSTSPRQKSNKSEASRAGHDPLLHLQTTSR